MVILRSSKLHDRSQDQGLPELDRTRRNRRRPGVGGIIGTDIPGIQEGEYCADGEDVIVLVKSHLGGCHTARDSKVKLHLFGMLMADQEGKDNVVIRNRSLYLP